MHGSQTPAHYPSYGVRHDAAYRKPLDLRPPSRLPWLLLILMLFGVICGSHLAWKERGHLLALVKKGEQSEQERRELTTRVLALEAEKSSLVSARDSLQRSIQARSNQLADLRMTHERLQDLLSDEILRGEITVNQTGDRLRVELTDRILFESGGTRLSRRGEGVLERLGGVLAKAGDRQLQVSGHTDNQAVPRKLRRRFSSNWDLSVARALGVVHFLKDKVRLPPERLAASGYGEHRPIDSNRSSGGRARNRRIEVVILPPLEPARLSARKAR